MKERKVIYSALTAALLLSLSSELLADNSGFLTDYSTLKPIAGSDSRLYTAPNAHTNRSSTFRRYAPPPDPKRLRPFGQLN